MKHLRRLSLTPLSEENKQDLIAGQVQFILSICSPIRIILFGSALSQKFYEDSDLDFVLIFPTKELAKLASKKLYTTPGRAWVSDYICVDLDTYESQSLIGGVLQVAREEGVDLGKMKSKITLEAPSFS